MANIKFTGYVDKLAGDSGTNNGFKIEIDFYDSFPNLISDTDDSDFTNDVGNWLDCTHRTDYARISNGSPSTLILGAVLESNVANRNIEPFETGRTYTISIDAWSPDLTEFWFGLSEQTQGNTGVWSPYKFLFTGLTPSPQTFTYTFVYTGETKFLNLWVEGTFTQDDVLDFDNVVITKEGNTTWTNKDFQVIEFNEFEMGEESPELDKLFVGNIKHSLRIRPDLALSNVWRTTLLDWQDVFLNEKMRVTYYRGTQSGSSVTYTNKFWRGIIDSDSVKCDLKENTLSFDVVDSMLGLKDTPTANNVLKYNIDDASADNYVAMVDVIVDVLNYYNENEPDDNFYSAAHVTNFCDLKGRDNDGQYATVSGYANGGGDGTARKYLAVNNHQYYAHTDVELPYGSTYGEMMGEFAFTILSRIQVGFNGKIYIEPIYTSGVTHSTQNIAVENCFDVESGIIPLANKGIRIKHKGLLTGTETLYEQESYCPSQSIVMSGNTVRKGCLDKVLTFLSDWVDSGNPFAISYDWYSVKTVSSTRSWSYFVTPGTYTYANQDRWTASYRNNNLVITTEELHFVQLWVRLFEQTLFLPKRYYKITVTGTDYDFAKWYTVGVDTKLYKIMSQKIDFVENKTELYLLEV